MNNFHRFLLGIANLVYPSKIYNKENIPEGSAVIICNHFSIADVVYIAKIYNKDISFLGKEEVFKKKIIGKLLKSCGGIPINRDNPDVKSMLSAIKILKNGHKLVIFPEGTRNKLGYGRPMSIKGGSAVFAVKAKCPIVPIMMVKKARVFRKNHIYVGEPFELPQFYGVKITDKEIEEMDDIILSKMIETQDKLIEILNNKAKKTK